MKNIAIFEKVSYEEFEKSIKENDRLASFLNDNYFTIDQLYDNIRLPERSSKRSAGYDFFFPLWDISIASFTSLDIPTGIKVNVLEEDWYLALFTKSGLSHEYHTRLRDTISVIDADYYNNINNEGHIRVELVNDSVSVLKLKNGMKYIQGIFMEYGLIVGDNVLTERTGGYGSTGNFSDKPV